MRKGLRQPLKAFVFYHCTPERRLIIGYETQVISSAAIQPLLSPLTFHGCATTSAEEPTSPTTSLPVPLPETVIFNTPISSVDAGYAKAPFVVTHTPHLLGSFARSRYPRRRTVPVRHADAARRRISLGRHLLQYVTWRAKANGIIKLRRFTKRLRYRCGRCFANFNHPFQTRDDRACRSRHEDAEGAQRAQCPNGSAPAVARPPRPCATHAKTGAECQTLRASYARSTDLNSATIFMSSPLAISMSR